MDVEVVLFTGLLKPCSCIVKMMASTMEAINRPTHEPAQQFPHSFDFDRVSLHVSPLLFSSCSPADIRFSVRIKLFCLVNSIQDERKNNEKKIFNRILSFDHVIDYREKKLCT